jgi:hypothetical protein
MTVLATGILWFRLLNKDYGRLAWLTGPFFLICPITAFWAVSGLELGLHCLLISLSLMAVIDHSRWLYLLGPLIVLNRPEGIAIALVIIIIFALLDFKKGEIIWKYYLVSLIANILIFSGLIALRMIIFGYPFPNTYYAKTHHPLIWGYKELAEMLLIFAPFTIGTVWYIIKFAAGRARNLKLIAFIIIFAVQAGISGRVDPIMNFFFRYMVPFFPLLITVSLASISGIKKSSVKNIAIGLCLISLLAPATMIFGRIELERTIMKAQWKVIDWAAELPDETTISMTDMGRIPYYTGNTYYDLWGLINRDTGHEAYNPAREFYRFPDYFVLVGYIESNRPKLRFGREQMIAYNAAFPQAYEFKQIFYPDDASPSQPGYYYLVFKRRDDALDKFRQP